MSLPILDKDFHIGTRLEIWGSGGFDCFLKGQSAVEGFEFVTHFTYCRLRAQKKKDLNLSLQGC